MESGASGISEAIQSPAARRATQMLEPAILLLVLEHEGAHGYELRQWVEELALADTEPDRSAVYRCLRWLEEHGQVRSQWDVSGGGPARRRYELTELGLKSLTLWADLLKHRRASLDRYLDRYRRVIARVRRRQRI
jgi:PadR family transcriptional regulator, regulatory protein PadR